MKKHLPLILGLIVLGALTALAAGTVPMPYESVKDKSRPHTNQVMTGQAPIMAEEVSEPATARRIPVPPSGNDDALATDDRVYQKTAYHEVVVNDVGQYTQQLKGYFLSIDGRVLSSSMNSGDKYQSSYLMVKVPEAKFTEATNRVTNDVDKVVSENISAYDRTGQYVNTQDKLANLQEQKIEKELELTQAQTELAKKQIQLEIDRLERQITQAQQRLENVTEDVTYATLQITAANNQRYFGRQSGQPTLREELTDAWESMSTVLYFLARLGIWIGIYAIIWLPAVLIVKWVVKKFKK
ncbi:MAG: DUF4349 domain-containing protein [Candidatus Pacebacteria bacterium]|nr:DUF4349 domain-containing protein [Candidatus Paceibacterota bacterium]